MTTVEQPVDVLLSDGTTVQLRQIRPDDAAAARCSSSTEPMPRPWWASATTNATSASSVSLSRS